MMNSAGAFVANRMFHKVTFIRLAPLDAKRRLHSLCKAQIGALICQLTVHACRL